MSFEERGKIILKDLGFQNIRRPEHLPVYVNYDFNDEKNGLKYAIEIKTTSEKGGVFSVNRGQVSEMARQFNLNNRKPLLLFIDEWINGEDHAENTINYFFYDKVCHF